MPIRLFMVLSQRLLATAFDALKVRLASAALGDLSDLIWPASLSHTGLRRARTGGRVRIETRLLTNAPSGNADARMGNPSRHCRAAADILSRCPAILSGRDRLDRWNIGRYCCSSSGRLRAETH